MSELLKEIKKLRKEVKEVKNILTDETSREYVQALIDNVSKTDKEMLSEEYLEYWTCDICGDHTHEVDYDYLGNGTNHLGCELKDEIAALDYGVDVKASKEKN
jgi:transcriptional regulator of met regulon